MKIKNQDGNSKRTVHVRAIIGWIILFSLTDAFFTDMGIRNGFVEEANPFAKSLYEWHWSAFYGFKVFLPILLFLVYPTIKNKKWINLGIVLCFSFYLLVNLYHFAWMGLVFYTL
jgi:hypothetical protein